ncbi:MAG: 50S ribosomal protein L5, partial [Elusimicrobiaceae bacterium]|nr:50S ribosomal protein L5 [Elusimicrobiaceae bacterium]
MARLKVFYNETVAPQLKEKFGYKNVMEIPKIEKIVINVGAGEAKDNSKVISSIVEDLGTITGQKPVV